MPKLLVETWVLALVVVDIDSETVDEIVVMGDVAANVTVGSGCIWQDPDADEASLTSDVVSRARSIVDECLSDEIPWQLFDQRG